MDSTVDWSQQLPELMELILDQLTCLSDHLRFASVCFSWRSITISNHCSRLLPFLMLPPDNNSTEIRPFFNLSSRKINNLHIPEIYRKWCCGSSHGWLVIVDESIGEIELFNPVSGGHIQLPSLSTFSLPQLSFESEFPSNKHYIHKAILSSDPYKTSEYVVVATVTNRFYLAYWKPGADKWTIITSEPEPWGCYEDVIFYEGLLYAASNHGPIVTYDFSSEPPIGREITPPNGFRRDMYYLVESLGELLLVLRNFRWLGDEQEDDDSLVVSSPFPFKTIKFQVHKLDESKRKWTKIESIGDCILFLGHNCSLSLSAKDFSECKWNSIYFNDDWDYGPYVPPRYGYHDIGVFNLESHRIESFLIESSPPILTTPTFWIAPEPVGSVSINFIFKLFNTD